MNVNEHGQLIDEAKSDAAFFIEVWKEKGNDNDYNQSKVLAMEFLDRAVDFTEKELKYFHTVAVFKIYPKPSADLVMQNFLS